VDIFKKLDQIQDVMDTDDGINEGVENLGDGAADIFRKLGRMKDVVDTEDDIKGSIEDLGDDSVDSLETLSRMNKEVDQRANVLDGDDMDDFHALTMNEKVDGIPDVEGTHDGIKERVDDLGNDAADILRKLGRMKDVVDTEVGAADGVDKVAEERIGEFSDLTMDDESSQIIENALDGDEDAVIFRKLDQIQDTMGTEDSVDDDVKERDDVLADDEVDIIKKLDQFQDVMDTDVDVDVLSGEDMGNFYDLTMNEKVDGIQDVEGTEDGIKERIGDLGDDTADIFRKFGRMKDVVDTEDIADIDGDETVKERDDELDGDENDDVIPRGDGLNQEKVDKIKAVLADNVGTNTMPTFDEVFNQRLDELADDELDHFYDLLMNGTVGDIDNALRVPDGSDHGREGGTDRQSRARRLYAVFGDVAVDQWIDSLSDGDIDYFYEMLMDDRSDQIMDAFRSDTGFDDYGYDDYDDYDDYDYLEYYGNGHDGLFESQYNSLHHKHRYDGVTSAHRGYGEMGDNLNPVQQGPNNDDECKHEPHNVEYQKYYNQKDVAALALKVFKCHFSKTVVANCEWGNEGNLLDHAFEKCPRPVTFDDGTVCSMAELCTGKKLSEKWVQSHADPKWEKLDCGLTKGVEPHPECKGKYIDYPSCKGTRRQINQDDEACSRTQFKKEKNTDCARTGSYGELWKAANTEMNAALTTKDDMMFQFNEDENKHELRNKGVYEYGKLRLKYMQHFAKTKNEELGASTCVNFAFGGLAAIVDEMHRSTDVNWDGAQIYVRAKRTGLDGHHFLIISDSEGKRIVKVDFWILAKSGDVSKGIKILPKKIDHKVKNCEADCALAYLGRGPRAEAGPVKYRFAGFN